ncbi:ATP-binding mismatch repair protein [Mycoemilia scoparia]|uniref:ATP-binding mismatch repair protein n=1 Tax=Mycoemilia scoparia TaxID=417184 RepID=A0A9W7ZVR7_9FUNG|nr:ATP-binding mismatch repair protein [Mycoemilia scoparia]
MAKSLVPLSNSDVHQLCSGQVIVDLRTAVKELLENSLDAGATNIEVRLKDHGLASITITDNGSGIDPSNYDSLCLKHWTSKLETFDDLESVKTFGFRGEALSSLCAMSKVTVTTNSRKPASSSSNNSGQSESTGLGMILEYDSMGKLTSKKPVAREPGTTITLSNIFANWPVRLQELKKNIKREFIKCVVIVEQYALISNHVRISLVHQPSAKGSGGGPVKTLLHTQTSHNMIQRIGGILGGHVKKNLEQFHITTTPSDANNDSGHNINNHLSEAIMNDHKFSAKGFISKPVPGAGRSNTDKQYIYINGRPCDLPSVKRAINEIYRGLNPTQYPIFLVDIGIDSKEIDVNITPNKRSILLKHEHQIVAWIHDEMKENVLAPSSSTYNTNNNNSSTLSKYTVNSSTNSAIGGNSGPTTKEATNDGIMITYCSGDGEGQNTGNKRMRLMSDQSADIENAANKGNNKTIANLVDINTTTTSKEAPVIHKSIPTSIEPTTSKDSIAPPLVNNNVSKVLRPVIIPTSPTPQKPKEIQNQPLLDKPAAPTATKPSKAVGNCRNQYITVKTNTSQIKQSYCNLNAKSKNKASHAAHLTSTNAEQQLLANISSKDQQAAEQVLDRTIHKADFKDMQIIGQFNLGFIIASLHNQDLYIIDQHASDEKFNFEELQQKAVISSQPLINQVPLKLSVVDENVVLDHLDVLSSNGFIIIKTNTPTDNKNDDDDDDDGVSVPLKGIGEKKDYDDIPGQQRLVLRSQPFIDNVVFTLDDLYELIGKLTDYYVKRPPATNPSNGEKGNCGRSGGTTTTTATCVPRCDRARRIFASRACRKSIMIGDALNTAEMTRIVRNLGKLEHPWNCPHGRPTMRHLYQLVGSSENDLVGNGRRRKKRLLLSLSGNSYNRANSFEDYMTL